MAHGYEFILEGYFVIFGSFCPLWRTQFHNLAGINTAYKPSSALPRMDDLQGSKLETG